MKDQYGNEIKPGGFVSYETKYRNGHFTEYEKHRFPVVEIEGKLYLKNKQGVTMSIERFDKVKLTYSNE